LLISWCAGGRCDMTCIDENHDRSRRPNVDDRDDHTCRVLGGRTFKMSDDAVCGLHCARGDEECEFLG
jgi:hypothetical protein